MPPYFNLLLVISSHPHRLPGFLVQFAHEYKRCFPHQIGHRGDGGFTGGFRYISALAFERVRTVCESDISERRRGTFLTSVVIPPSPPKLGEKSVRDICFIRFASCSLAK